MTWAEHTRKESGLKDSQEHTKPDHGMPVLREAKPDHDYTPSEGNEAQERTRPDLAAKNSGRRLE